MKRNLKFFVLGILLILSGAISPKTVAHDLPPECQRIANDIARIQGLRERATTRLRRASPSAKPALIAEIREFNAQLDRLRANLRDCRHRYGLPDPLEATFVGTSTLRTNNSDAPGPFVQSISVSLFFNEDRTSVSITDLRPISVSFDTPIGRVTTTVSRTGGSAGTFNRATGVITIPLTLHFHHDTVFAGDSDITFNLTTGSAGSPKSPFRQTGSALDKRGDVTVVGVARFRDGYLGGNQCSIVVNGRITPHP
jgi:hypothetical protein